MSPSDINRAPLADAEVVQYSAPSGLAIVGLLLGIASALGLVHPLGCILAVMGLVVSSLALRQIREAAGSLIGRKAALAGLGLSVLFATATAVEWISTRWLLEHEAEKVVQQWFEYFRRGEPALAHQMGMNYLVRRSPYLRMNSPPGSKTYFCGLSLGAERLSVPTDIFFIKPSHFRSGARPRNMWSEGLA